MDSYLTIFFLNTLEITIFCQILVCMRCLSWHLTVIKGKISEKYDMGIVSTFVYIGGQDTIMGINKFGIIRIK